LGHRRVDIGKHDNPFHRLLQNLRAPSPPARRHSNAPVARTRVSPSPASNPKNAAANCERGDDRDCPSEAKAILALLLELRRAITSLPVCSLPIEDDVAGQVAPTIARIRSNVACALR